MALQELTDESFYASRGMLRPRPKRLSSKAAHSPRARPDEFEVLSREAPLYIMHLTDTAFVARPKRQLRSHQKHASCCLVRVAVLVQRS